MEYKKKRYYLRNTISVPLIWLIFIPLLILDVFVELYHRICFPLYGLPYIKRSKYIVFDRHKLEYLPWYDKINCTYCGYANGFLQYAVQIAGMTEKYWCAIKHKELKEFVPPSHHKEFVGYGNKVEFEKKFLPQKKK